MKTFNAVVVSTKMQKTAVVEVVEKRPHPLYKKLLTKSTRFKADTNSMEVSVGDSVEIIQTRPISKDKHFKITKVLKKGEEK